MSLSIALHGIGAEYVDKDEWGDDVVGIYEYGQQLEEHREWIETGLGKQLGPDMVWYQGPPDGRLPPEQLGPIGALVPLKRYALYVGLTGKGPSSDGSLADDPLLQKATAGNLNVPFPHLMMHNGGWGYFLGLDFPMPMELGPENRLSIGSSKRLLHELTEINCVLSCRVGFHFDHGWDTEPVSGYEPVCASPDEEALEESMPFWLKRTKFVWSVMHYYAKLSMNRELAISLG